MEPKESILLNWSDFQNNTANSFQDVRSSLKYCDVTLACEDSTTLIEAHKVILASGSKFFERVLDQLPAAHPLLFLSGVGRKQMEAVLDFLYTGQARLPQGDLQDFLQAAQTLGVRGLQKPKPEDNADKYENSEESILLKHELDPANDSDAVKTNFYHESRSKKVSQKTSIVWKYIEMEGNVEDGHTGAKCKLCGKVFAWNNSTTSLLKHIQRKHRSIMESQTDGELISEKMMDNFSEIEDIQVIPQNSLINRNDTIFAVANDSKTDEQIVEIDGRHYNQLNYSDFERNETTYKLREIVETMTNEDTWEMSNDEEREAIKSALSNKSPV